MTERIPVDQPDNRTPLPLFPEVSVENTPPSSRIARAGRGLRDFATDHRSYLVPFALPIGATVLAFLAGACGGDDGAEVRLVSKDTPQVVKVGEDGEVTSVVANGGQSGAATPTEDNSISIGKGVPESLEPTATPTPELTILPLEKVSDVIEAAISSTNNPVLTRRVDVLRRNIKEAIERTPITETDDSYFLRTINNWGGAAQQLVPAACAEPDNSELKEALLMVIRREIDLWEKARDKMGPRYFPADSWGSFYRSDYKSPMAQANCNLPYLNQFDPEVK